MYLNNNIKEIFMEKLTFVTDDNDNVDLYIIEETRANGINYLLVSDSDDVCPSDGLFSCPCAAE